jgi:hypothetical protein
MIIFFLFRLPELYTLFGMPGTIIIKYRLLQWTSILAKLVLLVVFALTRSLYTCVLLIGAGLVSTYDASGDGLIGQLHSSRIFATWRESARTARYLVYAIVCLNLALGPGPTA